MAARNNRPPDRRVRRTRLAIRDALLVLMTERGWDEIGVQDICSQADIGRSTFYMHFSGKEALLLSGFDDLRRELRLRQAAAGEADGISLPFANGLIEHAYENQRVFRAMIGKRSGYVVQRRFRELVIDMIKEDLASLAPRGWPLDATAHYLAGAFVELLTWWLEARPARPPAEIDRLFHRLANPAIAQLRETKG